MTLSKLIKIVLEYMDEKGMIDDLKIKYKSEQRERKTSVKKSSGKNG